MTAAFGVAADAYDRFMGRYSVRLAPQLADLAGVREGMRIIDVGCGPGALTAELVERVGAPNVVAVDPSKSFVEAARERLPGVDVRIAPAEKLPYPDDCFDAALAQLVVHFMDDPVAGLREMARVCVPNGVVAACVWDHAGGRGPLSPFWDAARDLDPDVDDESGRAGAREGHLGELFRAAGLRGVEETELDSRATYDTFADWWSTFELAVGPAGAYYASLDDGRRAALRERALAHLPDAPFTLEARAWAARGLR
jgi:SAM-dependent methyltransferase